jgi:hypothetical protein
MRRLLLLALLLASPAVAHDVHHPENNDWYMSLKMPDAPDISCCGLADAYWADQIKVVDGKVYAQIQDERDDEMLGRPHIPSGTWVLIPPHKMLDAEQARTKGNPTGHSVVFIGYGNLDNVYCFVQGPLT